MAAATVAAAAAAAAAVTKATPAVGTSGATAVPALATAAAVPALAPATGVAAAATVPAPTSRAWVAAWVDRGAGIRTRGRVEGEDREDSGKVRIVFFFLSFPGLVPWADVRCLTGVV